MRTGELSRSGRKLRLPNQSFRVLAMLLERPGQLVTREELRASLWPSGTFVEYDQGLNAAVNRLREALRDSADKPRFIETLPRRGYRFIGTIEVQSASGVPSGALVSNTPPVQDVAHEGVRIGLLAIAGSLVALLVIAGTILSMSHRSAPGPPAHRDVVPFTSLPGQALAPTFSPDGSHIAFAWNGGNDDRRGFDLYVKEIGSERLLRLTNHPSDGIIPAWSPDGSSIAFVRFEDRAQEAGIFIIPALGGVERRVLSTGVVVGHLIHISWSPDGKRIAYPAYGYNGTPQIYLLSVDTLQTQPLSPAPECLDALQPAFSPDGTELALVCTSSSEVYTIYAVDIAHASLRRLASMMGDPQGLVWLADGSRIVFSNDAGRGGELWEVTLQGGLSELPFGEDGTAPAIAERG